MKPIFRFAILVALSMLGFVAPLRADDQTADQKAAKDAAVRCLTALGVGDAATLKSLSYDVDPDLLQVLADYAIVRRKFQETEKAKFKDVPARPDPQMVFTKMVETSQVHIEGDLGLLTGPSPKDRINLRRVDGQWKVDVTPFMPTIPAGFDKQYAIENMKGLMQVTADFTRDLPASNYPDYKAAEAALAKKSHDALEVTVAARHARYQKLSTQPGVAPTVSNPSSDESAARDAAIRYLAGIATGDAAVAKSVIITTRPEVLDAVADFTVAGRSVDAAGRAKFGPIHGIQRNSESTLEQLTAKLQPLEVKVMGDTAEASVGAGRPPMQLRRTGGVWRVVGTSVLPSQNDEQSRAAILKLHLESAVRRQVADEITQGKYSGWRDALSALEHKTAVALASNKEYQAALRAAGASAPKEPDSSPEAKAPEAKTPETKTPEPKTQSPSAPSSKDRAGLPEGATRSDMLGGHGGNPFVTVDSSERPVLGFHYALGHWAGAQVIQKLEPIFGDDAAAERGHPQTIVARDGYQVAGMIVSSDGKNTSAVRVIFARSKDGQLDLTHRYQSDWIGMPAKAATPKTLGADGKIVIGVFGRQGLNLDAVGLVLLPAASAPSTAPAK